MMKQEEEVVYLKIFDWEKGDVVFEGKVSRDVEPHELVKLTCFWEQQFDGFYSKATNERVTSFKGLQNNFELTASFYGEKEYFPGVLYIGADEGVVRKSYSVPVSESIQMTVWELSHEECEKAFKCETLKELELYYCKLRQIPIDIGGMKNLKKLSIEGLKELRSVPEEIGELSNLEELRVFLCGVECLPKRMKELKMLKSISLDCLYDLKLNAEDLVLFSKLKYLKLWSCSKALTRPSSAQTFWEVIKSTTDLRVLVMDWYWQDGEMVVAALEENGSIVDGGKYTDPYGHFFKRNRENHERAMECVLHLLAIRRWRNALSNVPKEMVGMIAMMLWVMRCVVGSWKRSPIE